MKKLSAFAVLSLVFLTLVCGCSNEESVEPKVNSGGLDSEYVGDPNPVLPEPFKQTEVEKQLLEDIKKKNEGTTFEGDGLAGH